MNKIRIILLVSAFAALMFSCRSKKPEKEKPVFSPNFTSDIESFRDYRYPDWFRDAKFGIWSHWGPQAVPRQGDWYARKMYESDVYNRRTKERNPSREYLYHVEHYGHPSVFGYKDIIPLWKAERWDPEKLMALYRRVGAKYFVSMGTHHDNFFLWDSKIHRWNAVRMGPMKDVVGLWQKAAKKEGFVSGSQSIWEQAIHGSRQVTDPIPLVP